jgi:hypothetical protein
MSLEEKLKLVLSVVENNKCILEENNFVELRNSLAKKKDPMCFNGFEPLRWMHIVQGVMKVLNINPEEATLAIIIISYFIVL